MVVTDGPRGSTVRYTNASGEPAVLKVEVFPRTKPPRDTNRAGEAYAATFIASLLAQGWEAGLRVAEEALIRTAARRASAAAALELDDLEFGFPGDHEVDRALETGSV